MIGALFDTVTQIRADGTVGPWLATDWSANEDFTEWTFNLVEGVTFHNGKTHSPLKPWLTCSHYSRLVRQQAES